VDLSVPIDFPGWTDSFLDEVNRWFLATAANLWNCVRDGAGRNLLDPKTWPTILSNDGSSLAEHMAERFGQDFPGACFWHHAWKFPLAVEEYDPDSPDEPPDMSRGSRW
jgi:hypothetical protein